MLYNCIECIILRLPLGLWLAKAQRPQLSVNLSRKNLPKAVRIFPLNSLSLCYVFKSAANTVASAIVVVVAALVHSAVVNFLVMERYVDF
jgi:hypothetical protein